MFLKDFDGNIVNFSSISRICKTDTDNEYCLSIIYNENTKVIITRSKSENYIDYIYDRIWENLYNGVSIDLGNIEKDYYKIRRW